MRYKRLGSTGLYVSELCLGTMTWGGKGFWESIGTLGLEAVVDQLRHAVDAGVNFIDTADIYHEGESERLLGAAIAKLGVSREQLVVATKVRCRTGPGPNQVGLSRSHILASVDASLRRLGLDHIDLYQVHGADPMTPLEETLDALDLCVRAGKVRYLGFCNLPAYKAARALGVAERRGLARFVAAQMFYSVVARDIEREVVPLAREEGLAVLPWSPLAGGLLSGKFHRDRPGPSGARRTSSDFPRVDLERTWACLDLMRPIAERHGVSVAQVALAWLLAQPHVTSVILGARTGEQLRDNLASVVVRLAPEELAAIEAVSALPVEYPGWMTEFQARDRLVPGADS